MKLSLVLVSPSTVMRLKLRSAAALDHGAKHVARHGGVGDDESKHRGHVRLDHARALADARDGDDRAVDVGLGRGGLVHRIGGHDRLRGLKPIAVRDIGVRGFNARQQPIHRQRLHDDARGEDKRLLDGTAREPGKLLARGARVGKAAFARACVGDARVGHEGADIARHRLMLAAHAHGRCGKAVLGEDPRDLAAFAKAHHHHVAAALLADARHGRPQLDAIDGKDRLRIGSTQIDRHVYLLKAAPG